MFYGSDYTLQLNQERKTMPKGLKLFAGNSHLQFAREVARHLDVRLYEPDLADKKGRQITWFSNGNCLVDIKENVRDFHCFIIQTQASGRALIGKDEQGNDLWGCDLRLSDMIMELFLMIHALKTSGATSVTVVMPYMPYIRSDKKDHARVCIGARLMADLLTESGADRILLMDPHFAQINGFFDEKIVKVEVLKGKPIIARHFLEKHDLEDYAIIAPDVGDSKPCGALATNLGLPMAIIDKRRYGDDEKAKPEALIGIDRVKGKVGIMPDDEVASGGTMIEGAEFVVGKGVKSLILAPTHAVFSSMKGLVAMEANAAIQEVIVTDTIPIDPEKRAALKKLKVIPVTRNFADAIRILFYGESLDKYKAGLYEGLSEMRNSRTKTVDS